MADLQTRFSFVLLCSGLICSSPGGSLIGGCLGGAWFWWFRCWPFCGIDLSLTRAAGVSTFQHVHNLGLFERLCNPYRQVVLSAILASSGAVAHWKLSSSQGRWIF